MIIYFLFMTILRYAFTCNRNGSVYVSLFSKRELIILIVRDNGDALPAHLGTQNLELVAILVKVLDGIFRIGDGQGNRYEINFPMAR